MYPDIVLGPPGTGKTTRLLSKVEAALERGVEPDKIGYVSFTKRAANEAITRAVKKFKIERTDFRYFRTLHSLCFNALGLSNGDVFEGKKVLEFGRWVGIELSEMRYSDDGLLIGFTAGDRALFMENLARVRGVDLREQFEHYSDGLPWNMVEHVGRALRQYKQDTQLLDYTDMLEHFVRMDWTPELDELFVDEAQDNSELQWQVVEKLASRAGRVTVAGDDDQAIYRWAGAAVERFVDMPGQVEVLGQSWRCPPEIQQLSDEVIARVLHRRPKEWRPRDGKGIINRVGSFDECDLSSQDILVLGRNAFVLRDVMEIIKSDGIIYEYKGKSSIPQSILSAVRLWETLRSGGSITSDEARSVYEYMSSGIGVRRGYKTLPGTPPDQMVTLQWLKDSGGLMVDTIWHEALDRIPDIDRIYLLRARQKGERTGKPRVRVSTIHSIKGGEADHVILLRDIATRTYDEMLDSPEDEARVWYVAVTRAINQLTIVAPRSRQQYEL